MANDSPRERAEQRDFNFDLYPWASLRAWAARAPRRPAQRSCSWRGSHYISTWLSSITFAMHDVAKKTSRSPLCLRELSLSLSRFILLITTTTTRMMMTDSAASLFFYKHRRAECRAHTQRTCITELKERELNNTPRTLFFSFSFSRKSQKRPPTFSFSLSLP